ncbi:MAG TPA: hypothetical protein VFE24_00405 [Pirellulales bacterium]|jgi:hypothetical protein|nr:hypothetical protein [Pirellulales bacterium]
MLARFCSGAVARLAVLASLTMIATAAQLVNGAAPRALLKGWSTAQHDAKVAQEAVNARAAGKQTGAGTQAPVGTQAGAGAADAQSSAVGEPGVAKEERLKDVAVLQGLVANLSAADFATREAATRELMKAGREAFPLLREAESTGDKETQSRARKILDEIEWPVTAAAIKKIEKLGGKVIGPDRKRPRGVMFDPGGDRRSNVNDDDVSCIADLHYLIGLNLCRTDITDKTCARIGKLPLVVNLYLDETNVTDAGVREFRYLSHLKYLSLSATEVTGEGFAELADIATLREVNVARSRVTDSGMAQIAKCHSINQLEVNNNRITSAGLKSLKSLKLITVSLDKTHITDEGIAELRQHPLTSLTMGSTAITDKGLAYASEIETLNSIDVSGTQVTKEGLKQVRTMPHLKNLWACGLDLKQTDAQAILDGAVSLKAVFFRPDQRPAERE